jgi:tellurite methyltransferase
MTSSSRDKWNARYQARRPEVETPSEVLRQLDPYLPRAGRALDVAGGAGRNAIWLARRGLDVTLCDISPVGLQLATRRAEAAGVALKTREIDLENEDFPGGPWDLIVSVLYLWRPLLRKSVEQLAPGGVLAVIQPTRANLQRHPKPPLEYLLAEGELAALAEPLAILHYSEGWQVDGRHDAVLVARKPGAGMNELLPSACYPAPH